MIERDIYEQYKRRHFDTPWESALALGGNYEIPDDPGPALGNLVADPQH